MTDPFDYGEAPPPGGDKLDTIMNLVRRCRSLDVEIDQRLAALKLLVDERENIAAKQLPNLLDETGVESITLPTGHKVEIDEDLKMSIPKKSKAEAYKWLAANGGREYINKLYQIPVRKEDTELAKKLEKLFAENKIGFNAEDSAAGASVKAFLKRKQKAGADVPLKLFGAHEIRKAKITDPRD